MDTIAVAAQETTGTPIAKIPLQQKVVDARTGREMSPEEAAKVTEASTKTVVPTVVQPQSPAAPTTAPETTTDSATDPWN
jgi:hypothetical protein